MTEHHRFERGVPTLITRMPVTSDATSGCLVAITAWEVFFRRACTGLNRGVTEQAALDESMASRAEGWSSLHFCRLRSLSSRYSHGVWLHDGLLGGAERPECAGAPGFQDR